MEKSFMNYKRKLIYRKIVSFIVMGLTFIAALTAVVPLAFIFYYTVSKGITHLNIDFFISMPKPVGEPGGGMANAIVGTLILVGIGALIGLPIGIMAGIYLAEFGNNKFGLLLRFLTDVLSGIPSIVIGVVAYTLVVIPMGHFSALAGGVALAILMIPTVTRTTEEMIKLVPHSYREAGLGLGIPKWKTSLFIVLRTAWKGIATGILLALSRAAGETAPLLFTALGNRFWSTNIFQPIASLTVYIYDYARAPFEDWNNQAWTAALVLILFISIFSIAFRIITRSKYKTN
ncbi:MAG: phosphate ABC transporter permease PstA [Melioribacter sp.]|uniref:phosphate ABC transporter permease PstA n=1 Tax=Rosettibacter primus TaxID=3111523 RepID=UPI00247DE9E0|nr:phosphate ABC transporter permease PstA [Melioribacter sp.]